MSQSGQEASTTNGAAYVIDKNGVRGVIQHPDTDFRRDDSQVFIRTGDGASYLVRSDVLVELKDGGYFLPVALRDMTPHATPDVVNQSDAINHPLANRNASTGVTTPITAAPTNTNADSAHAHATSVNDEFLVVPIIAEELQLDVRAVERGRVRITKTVSEREEIVDEPLRTEDAVIERVAINRVVEVAPPVRYEGDVMVVSLVEEVIVIEKKLVLREELRVSKKTTETRKPQTVVLRREEANIEHLATNPPQDDLLSLEADAK